MNTALIIGYDADDVILNKTRTNDDHDAIWGVVTLWMENEDIATVNVKRFDSSDILVQEYNVALVPAA